MKLYFENLLGSIRAAVGLALIIPVVLLTLLISGILGTPYREVIEDLEKLFNE